MLILILSACATRKPFYSFEHRGWEESTPPDSTHRILSIFLAGDTGNPKTDGEDPFLELLKYHIQSDTTSADALVFLGDNVYETGMPPEYDIYRDKAEEKLRVQMDAVSDFQGQVIFIPGNHDWNNGRRYGYATLLRQQAFIEDYMQQDSVFLPLNGCPGPVEMQLTENIVIIIVDSQWYLHSHFRPSYPDCLVQDEQDFFYELGQAVKRNEGKHILIAMHHPLYSNGNHGGYFSFKDNIFPLTLPGSNNKWYIPLPLIGSIYPMLRKYGISEQDIAHPLYEEMKQGILKAVAGIENVVFAAGHDHSLQLIKIRDRNYIISGSGSKLNHARRGQDATYVHTAPGLARVSYYDNGEVWIEYYTVNGEPSGNLSFRAPLYSLDPRVTPVASLEIEEQHYKDSIKTDAAGKEYKMGNFGKFFLGEHYRKEWTTPVTMKYLDLQHFAGGLKPIKRGGGQQTIGLRMMGADNNQYNIRSINKNPDKALPVAFRNTLAEDIIKDQISGSHPYGAFTIPPMARAAGLYYTNPELVYVPYSPLLGNYIETFGGMIAMIEIRPDEDLSEFSRFGHSENVVSTETLLEHLRKDNDHEADAEMFLKSRLFDLLIGDWDRHIDQWRWAEFEKEDKGSFFRPVPRDRDQVYAKFDGLLPWLASRKWAFRKFSHFDYDFGDVVGLASGGTVLDRQILNGMALEDWEKAAEELKQDLTDEVIEEAIRELPPEVYPISGPEISAKLKSRRDKLTDAAITYYLALSKYVDILGTNKHEKFEVVRQSSGSTRVTVLKTYKEGEERKVIYDRTFDPEITKELRIYTFEGNDEVLISGDPSDEIKIRIITGNETEQIRNESGEDEVIVYKRTFYDDLEIHGENIEVKSSPREYITEYDPGAFKFNYFGPRLSVEYNRDDGFFLGGGVNWKTYGFQREQYASSHTLLANYATNTGAYNFSYFGEFPDLLGHNLDLVIDTRNYGPKYVFNYFGPGNGTENNMPIDFYRLNMKGFIQKIYMQKSTPGSFEAGIGPMFEYYNVTPNEETIIDKEPFNEDLDTDEDYFVGGEFYLNLRRTDFKTNPRNGLKWNNNMRFLNALNGSEKYVKLRSDLSVFLTPNLPLLMTLGLRLGVETNVGSYPFYHSSFIGGGSNLRGFRLQRFAGHTAVYQNTELRLRLARLRTYLFNGYMGVYGFLDMGRVWAGEPAIENDVWHKGYGPGLWVTFFNLFLTAAEVGFSEEGSYFYLRTGFFF
jgi:hypothetical protein